MKSMLLGALASTLVAGALTANAADPYYTPGAPDQYVTPTGYGQAGGYALDIDDGADRYASGFERWCTNIKDCVRDTRRLGYKRLQKKHRDLLYPQCPPYCSPTHGYYHTRWRRFSEECEYMWSGAPGDVIYESPGMASPSVLPLSPSPTYQQAEPPALAPPAAEPYFPESPPVIQPADPGAAPPAPETDPTAPPAPPAEVDLDPAGETFLPARPAAEPASFEEPPALLQFN